VLQAFGAAVFVTGVFGLAAAGEVVRTLLGVEVTPG
jgi:tRNA A37 threonylcarbamoyladenosine dehydratase